MISTSGGRFVDNTLNLHSGDGSGIFLIQVVPSDQALHIKDSIFWVDRGLILGSVSNKVVARIEECYVGGCDTVTSVVGNEFDTAVFEYSDAGVGCSKVDSDDSSHLGFFLRHGKWGGQEGH